MEVNLLMLNELYPLVRGIEQYQGNITIKHKDIQTPGKGGQTLHIYLYKPGEIKRIEYMSSEDTENCMSSEDTENCWTIGDGNKNQFPSIKLIQPLRPDGHQAYAKWRDEVNKPSDAEFLKFLESLWKKYELDLQDASQWPTYRNKISERGLMLEGLISTKAEAAYSLYHRFLSSGNNGLDLLREIDKKLIDYCIKQPDSDLLKLAGNIYFGDELGGKGMIKDGKRPTLFFDVLPEGNDIYTGANKVWIPYITEELNKNLNVKTRNGTCAITGEKTDIVADKFPKEKLPVIGNTILFSKYDGSGNESVMRYKQSQTDAYSLGIKLSGKMAGALVEITRPENENITWAMVPSETKSPDLLIAYCKNSEEIRPVGKVIDSEMPEDMDDVQERTKEIIKAQQGKDIDLTEPVHFFLLRKINDGNQKTIYSTTCSLIKLNEASSKWDAACKDSFPTRLLVKFKKKKKPIPCRPWNISPIKLIRLFRNEYTLSSRNNTVSGINFSDAMILFFMEGNNIKPVAQRMLGKLYKQYRKLFERAALTKLICDGAANTSLTKTSYEENAEILSAITAFSLLFNKLSKTKEDIMKDLAFKLGQYFSAVDEIHCGYYFDHNEKVKKLPQLIGNQAYNRCLNTPLSAFEILTKRYAIYEKWVLELKTSERLREMRSRIKQARETNEKPKLKDEVISNAIYAKRSLSKLSDEIKPNLDKLDQKPSALFKAELMLGYISGRPYPEKSTTNTSSTQ